MLARIESTRRRGRRGGVRYGRPVPRPGHNESVVRECSKQADSFEDRRYALGAPRVMAWILDHVPAGPRDSVLDVAAGTGHVGRALAPKVRHVTALDLTAEMLSVGKRAADAAGVHTGLLELGAAARLPYLA